MNTTTSSMLTLDQLLAEPGVSVKNLRFDSGTYVFRVFSPLPNGRSYVKEIDFDPQICKGIDSFAITCLEKGEVLLISNEFYEKLGPYLPYLGIKRINYGDGASQITRDNSEGIFCLGKKIEGSYHCMFYEEK